MTAQAGAFTSASLAGLPIYPYYCRTLSLTLGRWCPLRVSDVYALEEVDDFAGMYSYRSAWFNLLEIIHCKTVSEGVRLTKGTGQNVYFYKNHMIKYVRLTGVIVAMDEFPGWIVLTLDDSSGATIEATCAAPVKPATSSLPEPGDAMADGIVTTLDTKPAAIAINPMIDASKTAASAPQEIISPDGPNLTNIDVGSVVKIKGGIRVFRGQRQIRLKSIAILGDTNAEVKCWNDVVKFKREVLSLPWVVTPEDEEGCRLEEDREARWKKEEEIKKKKDHLKRHLKEKARELREVQREQERAGENATRREPVENRKHRERSSDMESSCGREDREKRRKHKERSGDLEILKEADIEGEGTQPKERTDEGLQPVNRVNHPSRAARMRAAGKYDALGM
jgi:hypothetical protein